MAMFDVCPKCGANLDPGERCDCQKEKASSEMTPLKKRDIAVDKAFNWAVTHSSLTH